MRPVYETQAHLQGEEGVAKKLEAWINNPLATVVKTPPLAPYDYCIVKKGLISGVVEIKVRSNPSDKYPTYMISLEKVSQCTSHANIIGCPFYVVVQWTDKLEIQEAGLHYRTYVLLRYPLGDANRIQPKILREKLLDQSRKRAREGHQELRGRTEGGV